MREPSGVQSHGSRMKSVWKSPKNGVDDEGHYLFHKDFLMFQYFIHFIFSDVN